MTVSGIDIASYQSTDYSTAGLAFVAVKATEGTGYVNPKHDAQVAHARDLDLVVAHYHFVRPGNMSQQAGFFLAHALPRPGDILCLDWEDAGVSGADKDTWIQILQSRAAGHRVILYCNRDFWFHHDTTNVCGDGLWIADPDAPAGHPRVTHPWVIHQYGIRGTDRDVANFPDAAALHAWAAGSTLTPSTTQEHDMQKTDILTIPKGAWASEPESATAEAWITNGNKKAEAAVAAVRVLSAQVGALTATVTALAAAVQKGGGLTAEQTEAAAKAGADAALAELGHALANTSTTGA